MIALFNVAAQGRSPAGADVPESFPLFCGNGRPPSIQERLSVLTKDIGQFKAMFAHLLLPSPSSVRISRICRLRDRLASNTKFTKFVPAIMHYDPLQDGPPASGLGARDVAVSVVELDSSPPSPDAWRSPGLPSNAAPGSVRRRQRWSVLGQRFFARNR